MIEILVPAVLWFTSFAAIFAFVMGRMASSDYHSLAAVIVAVVVAISWWAWVETSWNPSVLLASALYAIGVGALVIGALALVAWRQKPTPKA